jgi:hypothetical protein
LYPVPLAKGKEQWVRHADARKICKKPVLSADVVFLLAGGESFLSGIARALLHPRDRSSAQLEGFEETLLLPIVEIHHQQTLHRKMGKLAFVERLLHMTKRMPSQRAQALRCCC